MTPGNIFTAVVVVSILNGFLSPVVALVFILAPIWLPVFVPARPEMALYGASLIVSTGTLLASGVPAALYERLRGQQTSDVASMLIWLGAAILLTLPGLLRLL